jgi:hypothetical protein
MNQSTTNVVVPYTNQWIWSSVTDPIKANTGQPRNGLIMDMVACGRKDGAVVTCPH